MNVPELVAKLRIASKEYYTTGNSPMSDDEYDAAVELLRKVAPESPYLAEIGPAPDSSSKKIYHTIPMGTLSKYHTDAEITVWLQSSSLAPFTQGVLISPKYDGFGVEIVYQDGKLVVASTRGTGHLGEDITESVNLMKTVPKDLGRNVDLIVRGEAIIPKVHRALLEEKGYKSLRNAVPGIVRSCEKELLPLVHFVAYNAFGTYLSARRCATQWDIRNVLTDLNFIVENVGPRAYRNFPELKTQYEFIRTVDGTYEYDGVVLKDNRITDDNWLTPSHQVAWKFQSKVQVTTLRDVEYQIGTTGKFTPVAIFDPVCFQGATLTRASLGSYARFKDLIDTKGMKIGSQVAITRQGDIIPYVQDVVDSTGLDGEVRDIEELKICPYCGEELVNTGANLICPNKKDPTVVASKISAYISGIGVKGIGLGMITKLVDAGYLTQVSDLYKLDPESVKVKGWGSSAVKKWQILQSKPLQLVEVLANYPFENCGGSTWSKLVSAVGASVLRDEILIGGFLPTEFNRTSVKGLSESKLSDIEAQIKDNEEDLKYIIEVVVK